MVKSDRIKGATKDMPIDKWIEMLLLGCYTLQGPNVLKNILQKSVQDFPFSDIPLFKKLLENLNNAPEYDYSYHVNSVLRGTDNPSEDHCFTCRSQDPQVRCTTCK